MRRIEFIVIAAVLLLAPTPPSNSARQVTAPETGALEVTVIDSRTGEGIPEAEIQLIESAPSGLRTSEFSDSAGRFTRKDLAPGRYRVVVQSEGYFPPQPSVVVSAGQTARVTVSMIPGGTIGGRVTVDGKPQSGVTVQAFQIFYLNGYPKMDATASRVTDDRGQYRLFYLSSGEYLVAVTPRDTPKISFFNVTRMSSPLMPESTAPPEEQEEQPQRTFYPGTVDRSGAERILIRAGRDVANIDIPLKTSRVYRVSGEIRVPAPTPPIVAADPQTSTRRTPTPVSARVNLMLHDANSPDDLFIESGSSLSVILEPAGAFLVGAFQAHGVPPGISDWIVNGISIDGTGLPAMAFPVEVRASDVEGLRFDIRPGVTLKGTMTVDAAPPGANKNYVRFQIDGVFSRWLGSPRYDVSADEKTGALSIARVSLGHFRAVRGDGMPKNLYIEDVRSGDQSVFDAGFEVGNAEPAPVDVVLRSGAATISGSVIDEAGKPAANAVVALVPASNRQNIARFHDVSADANAKFTISSVAPGDYLLFAWPTGSLVGATFNAAFLSRFEEKGVPATVPGKGATVTVDLTAIQ